METILQKRRYLPDRTLTFLLVGDLAGREFFPWMEKHARKLGVGMTVLEQSENEIRLQAVGPAEMAHAFALACSLGPHSVRIDQLEILAEAETP